MVQRVEYLRDLVTALTGEEWTITRKITIKCGQKPEIAIRYLNHNCYIPDPKKPQEKKPKETKYLESEEGVKFIDFPFYCTFTAEVVRYYFLQDLFDGDRIKLKKAMKIPNYLEVYARCYKKHKKTPGWHTSNNRIHTFAKDGIERFRKELNAFPDKIYNQVIYSIALDYWKNCDKGKTLKESNNKIWKDLINEFEIE